MRKLAIIVVLLPGLLAGCIKYKNTEDRHQIITICNRLEHNIYYKLGDYRGNLLNYNPIKQPEYMIGANDCQDEYSGGFEYIIEHTDSNRLTCYFFNSEVLHTVPWDTVYQHRMFSVRHYTKPMLDSLGWRVEFP